MYWGEDVPDKRDLALGYDTSDALKRRLIGDLLARLQEARWLSADRTSLKLDDLVKQAVAGSESPFGSGARITSLIEFGRAVHAEMAAIVDAARRGLSVKGCTLYTTTFPCHDCARHIIAAGIERVVYIEPYPKSLALEFHADAVELDPVSRSGDKVSFHPFVGVAPRQYMDLFSMLERKRADGTVIAWESSKARPRYSDDAVSQISRYREVVYSKPLEGRFESLMCGDKGGE